MRKKFVAVRAAYYKHQALTKEVKTNHKIQRKSKDGSNETVVEPTTVLKKYKSAIAEFEHILRTKNTNSVNVFPEFTKNNIVFSPKGSASPLDAYYKCREQYKKVVGRKCRQDMNTLFEHVVVLSEEQVAYLEKKYGKEKVNKKVVELLQNYANSYAEKYGFFFCGGAYHADEGFYDDNGTFKRNVHAHIMFFNYDFKAKQSNLKHLFKKSINPKTGATNELNPYFVDMQDMAYQCFKSIGFKRGESKLITMKQYLPKYQYLEKKLKLVKNKYAKTVTAIQQQKEKLTSYLNEMLKKIASGEDAEAEKSITSHLIAEIGDEALGNRFNEVINKRTRKPRGK